MKLYQRPPEDTNKQSMIVEMVKMLLEIILNIKVEYK